FAIGASTLFKAQRPQQFTPDIKKMNFQYITSCKNYSEPLLQAEKLWRHMNFNKVRKVVILATGWTNTVNDSSALAMLSQAYLCRKDVNFIIVDAGYYVDTLYKWSAMNTEEIGESIGKGLKHLIKVVPLQNIHLIGHSLGAHIMGTAGRTFTKLTGKKIPRITGLDAAKPCFRSDDTLTGLHRGDAEFVDVIHTNIGVLAKKEPIGDIDFYPGGANPLPPGCLTISCAHSRAVEYFAESVYPGNAKNFIGWRCSDFQALEKLKCNRKITSPMGIAVDQQQRGIFYVPVNSNSPFGKTAKPSSERWQNARCHKCEKSKQIKKQRAGFRKLGKRRRRDNGRKCIKCRKVNKARKPKKGKQAKYAKLGKKAKQPRAAKQAKAVERARSRKRNIRPKQPNKAKNLKEKTSMKA
ncbi:vitellogenin-1-like, partial [Rhagoletis pomonella]|uniref:vitellogenin-1-like n=1 Tax=Rhagoletis pomonella TaxID=28610 RepID=UPI00177B18AA